MSAPQSSPQSTPAAGALDGIRVLDLSSVIMGPYATQVLGDLGADVIKVETGSGDTNRFMGGGPHPELSGIALNLHRNKRAVLLDLKSTDGKEAFLRILDSCDVFVTNMRPAALARLGLTYEDVGPERPRLIYCQAQGFRTGTPEENRPAYDDIIQASTGLPRLNELVIGRTAFLPIIIGDKIASTAIVQGVLAALVARGRTGRGQRVEIPMFDALMSFNLVEHLSRAAIPGQPAYYSRTIATTRGPHKTKDGYIAMMPYTDEHWNRLFDSVGRLALLQDPRFCDNNNRLLNAELIYGELAAICATRTTAEWLELCDELDIPANAVPSIEEIIEDDELNRGMITMAEHPVIGSYRSVGPGIKLYDTPATVRRPAPMLGEHTAEVLAEVGYDAADIAKLTESGAATVRPPDA